MIDHLRRLAATVTSMVTRGVVTNAIIGPRALCDMTGLDNEIFAGVELLLPYGYCARPLPGADVLILQANAVRDHKVALGGDAIEDRQADLQPGEVGISRAGQRVILRDGFVEIVSGAAIRLVAPLLEWSPDGATFYPLATSVHTHADPQGGNTSPTGPAPMVTG